jgi:hypothetical protein
MKTLEASKAVGDFSKLLEQVLSKQESFQIVSKGVPFAYLIPANNRGCSSHEFADDLAANPLAAGDRQALGVAVRRARKALRPLENPWA